MKIKHTFKGMLTGEVKNIVEDDGTSPNGGYTQAHANRNGAGYVESGRAEELLGTSDYWEWEKSEYVSPRW